MMDFCHEDYSTCILTVDSDELVHSAAFHLDPHWILN